MVSRDVHIAAEKYWGVYKTSIQCELKDGPLLKELIVKEGGRRQGIIEHSNFLMYYELEHMKYYPPPHWYNIDKRITYLAIVAGPQKPLRGLRFLAALALRAILKCEMEELAWIGGPTKAWKKQVRELCEAMKKVPVVHPYTELDYIILYCEEKREDWFENYMNKKADDNDDISLSTQKTAQTEQGY